MKVPQYSNTGAISLTSAATAYYFPPAVIAPVISVVDTVESQAQLRYRLPGVLSLLAITLTVNNRGASSGRVRINGANGNQSVSPGASATGLFEDTTNTDTVAASDLAAISYTTGTGGSASSIGQSSTHFAATTDTVQKMGIGGHFNLSTASQTRDMPAIGVFLTAADETVVFTRMDAAGTLKNLQVAVSANARTSSTTVRIRKNAANGNQTLSVGAGATGIFEDTTNTDAVAIGDSVGHRFISGLGTGTLTFQSMTMDLVLTGRDFPLTSGRDGSGGVSPGATVYSGLGGIDMTSTTTEAHAQARARIPFRWKALGASCVFNTYPDGALVLTARKNGADTLMTCTIPLGATGDFSDVTNAVDVAVGDLLAIKAVSTATSGACIPSRFGGRGTVLPEVASGVVY